jgi:hypothetical protein
MDFVAIDFETADPGRASACAIGLALVGVLAPLACHWVGLAAFTGRPLLALAVLSLLFGAIDAALTPRLPLSLDKELNEL